MKNNMNEKWNNIRVTIIVIVIVMCILGYFGYLFYQDAHKQPKANQIVKIGNRYEMTDTRYFCKRIFTHDYKCFSVIKEDSIDVLKKEDICYHCGNEFERHHSGPMWVVMELSTYERE